MQKTYLIIGASAAGIGAITKLRQLDRHARIVCVSDEHEFPYNKCFLVDYLSKEKMLDQVYTKPQDFFEKNSIELKLATRIVKIDPKAHEVHCQDGEVIAYTKLLLGLGGALHIPVIQGGEGIQGIIPFYNLRDTHNIKMWIEKSNTKHVVIIGAGLSGLECADALVGYNTTITIIDRNSQVLGRQVDSAGAAFIQKKAENQGIRFYFERLITTIKSSDGVVTAVLLDDGTLLKADMVICALGARPNIYLVQEAGIVIEDGAIATNEWLQTSDRDIYAAGDNALVLNRLTGKKMRNCTWPDALVQGMTAGANMIAHTKSYAGVTLITASHFFGLSFHVAGNVLEVPFELIRLQEADSFYQKVALSLSGVVTGFLLIGHTQHLSALKRSLLSNTVLEKDLL